MIGEHGHRISLEASSLVKYWTGQCRLHFAIGLIGQRDTFHECAVRSGRLIVLDVALSLSGSSRHFESQESP